MDETSEDRQTGHYQYNIGGSNFSGSYNVDNGAIANIGNHVHFNTGKSDPPKPSSFQLIPQDPDFVDRPEILQWLHKKCAQPAGRAALIGLSGVGKSQIAIQFAHQVRERSKNTWVFWVNASTNDRLEEAYRSIADKLKLPGRENPKMNVFRLVRDWLNNEENGQWVMILDSADDFEMFRSTSERRPVSILPQSINGSILITSRNLDVANRLTGADDNIYQVPAMDEEQALQLFRNKLKKDCYKDDAVDLGKAPDLVNALDLMPLAITQAASYINNSRRKHRMSVSLYLKKFQASDKSKTNLLNNNDGDLRREESVSNSVVTTWQITFEQVKQERPSAADLLSFMSFFNPHGIPDSVLRKYWVDKEEDVEEDDFDEFEFDLEVLKAYCLLTITETDILMQGLVQFCTRVWLSSSQGTEPWKRKFREIISKEFPSGEYETWTECRKLTPHIEWVIREPPKDVDDVRIWTRLLTNSGWYQYKIGSYKVAEERLREAVDIMYKDDICGKEHPDTLAVVDYFGVVLEKQCKYDEAVKWNRRALEGREKVLGRDDKKTLESLSNFAMTLEGQANYTEAEKMNRRALEKREETFGKDSVYTIQSVNNLANTLRYQARYPEAVEMITRAYTWREKNLGMEHPDTMDSLSSWASTLQGEGKVNEAAKISQEALARRKQALGIAHPDTLLNMSDLALILLQQGKVSEAKKMSEEALKGIKARLGSSNPDTFTVYHSLAVVSTVLKDYKKAEELYKTALGNFEDQLGPYHPHTLGTMTNLAVVLRKQKRFDEAKAIYQKAVPGFTKCFGATHPDTLTCLSNLAVVLEKQGELHEAEKAAVEALQGFEKSLQQNHPTTLQCMSILLRLLQSQEKYNAAEDISRRMVGGLEATLGPENPKTLKSMGDLAYLLQCEQRYHDAWHLYETVCQKYKKLAHSDKASQTCFQRFASLQDEMKSQDLTLPSETNMRTVSSSDEENTLEETSESDQEPEIPAGIAADMKVKRQRPSYDLEELEDKQKFKRQKASTTS